MAAEPLYPDSTGKQKYNDDNVYFTGNSKNHELTGQLGLYWKESGSSTPFFLRLPFNLRCKRQNSL